MIFMFSCAARIGMGPVYVIYGVGRFCMESDEWGTGRFTSLAASSVFPDMVK